MLKFLWTSVSTSSLKSCWKIGEEHHKNAEILQEQINCRFSVLSNSRRHSNKRNLTYFSGMKRTRRNSSEFPYWNRDEKNSKSSRASNNSKSPLLLVPFPKYIYLIESLNLSFKYRKNDVICRYRWNIELVESVKEIFSSLIWAIFTVENFNFDLKRFFFLVSHSLPSSRRLFVVWITQTLLLGRTRWWYGDAQLKIGTESSDVCKLY